MLNPNNKHINSIVKDVPPNYYQTGIEGNFLQRIWHFRKLGTVRELISYEPKKILDVGCNSGWFIDKISSYFPNSNCTGIDIYEKAIKYARKEYPHILFKVADVHYIPYPDQIYDLILCTEVLEHVSDPDIVVKELKRLIKNDGKIIIELDSGSFLFKIAWFVWKRFKGKVWKYAHLHSFNEKKIERLLLKNKFKIEQKKKFNLSMGIIYLISK